MKVCGFTFIRNAVKYDYPIVESISSILPLCDKFIVVVGNSEDNTRNLVERIEPSKITIIDSIWDESLREGGKVLAFETNKAIDALPPEYDWGFYIQGDEVVHEKYHETIINSCQVYKDNLDVQGLLFAYKHFYGTYDYVGDSRKWYDHEVRIIRNNKKITAYKDAQGFRIGETKLRVKEIDAYIYHYGWVKSPEQMMKKHKNASTLWHPDEALIEMMQSPDFWNFNDFDSLQKFDVTHPAIMLPRIAAKNWHIDMDISKKKFSFKEKLLYYFEKLTGIRPFDFRNYKVIK